MHGARATTRPALASTPQTFAAHYIQNNLKHTVFALRKLLKRDKRHDRDSQVEAATQATEHGNFKLFYEALRKHKRYSPRPPAGIIKSDGAPAQDASEITRVWQHFFADLLDGYRGEQHLHGDAPHGDGVDRRVQIRGKSAAQYVPSWQTVCDRCAACVAGRAALPDGLLPEMHRCLPDVMANITYPLIAKAVLSASKPPHWRGGFPRHALQGQVRSHVVSVPQGHLRREHRN